MFADLWYTYGNFLLFSHFNIFVCPEKYKKSLLEYFNTI